MSENSIPRGSNVIEVFSKSYKNVFLGNDIYIYIYIYNVIYNVFLGNDIYIYIYIYISLPRKTLYITLYIYIYIYISLPRKTFLYDFENTSMTLDPRGIEFSLTWPASTLIYWNKRKFLHKKRDQLPQDCLGTPTNTLTWPPFYCFGTPIWPP